MEKNWGEIPRLKPKTPSRKKDDPYDKSSVLAENSEKKRNTTQNKLAPEDGKKLTKEQITESEQKGGKVESKSEWTEIIKKKESKLDKFESKTLSLGEKKSKTQKKEKTNNSELGQSELAKWEIEQKALAQKIKEFDDFVWSIDQNREKRPLKYVAGMDISFSNVDPDDACSYLVVLSYPSLQVVYEGFEIIRLNIPYIPGFLAFREGPHYMKLFEEMMKKRPEIKPDVILFDGNGILHSRGCGIASHMGLLFDIPTIGIGKTFFAVDGLGEKMVLQKCDEAFQTQNFMYLEGRSKRTWGAALKTDVNSNNPIYVSVGHRISLKTACDLIWKLCKQGPIPQPVKLIFPKQNLFKISYSIKGFTSRSDFPKENKKENLAAVLGLST